jgi:hypothetical protein
VTALLVAALLADPWPHDRAPEDERLCVAVGVLVVMMVGILSATRWET